MYAKFIDENTIEYPPKNKGNVLNYDCNVDLLIKDGYKPVCILDNKLSDAKITYTEEIDCIKETQTQADIEKYQIEQRLKEIDAELEAVKKAADEFLNTPIIYPVNGSSYYPRYVQEVYNDLTQAETELQQMRAAASPEQLALLPESTFPQKIKDTTKLAENERYMTLQELMQLKLFLSQTGYQAWSIKEQKEAELLKEKGELLK